MRTGNIFGYIMLILLVLMIGGVVSLGDVMSVFFYIIMGILAIVLIGVFFVRYKISKAAREAARNGGNARGGYKTYTWSSRGGAPESGAGTSARNRNEGDVTIKRTAASQQKVVRGDVGDYVEYEEIETETVKKE